MKSALVLLVAAAAACANAQLDNSTKQFLFTRWMETYQQKFEVSELFSRFETFNENLAKIVAFNAESAQSNDSSSVKLALNQFAHLTTAEYQQMLGLKKIKTSKKAAAKAPCMNSTGAHPTKDWREDGVVNAVKDQGQCGSCWAFSTIAPIETAYAIKTGKLLSFSEQALVDCDKTSEGCNGGYMRTSLEEYWVAKKAKAWLTSDYPYKAKDGTCKGDGSVDVNVTGVGDGNTYAGLVEGVNQGTVSIGIAASGFAFQFYSKGIVKGSSCKDTDLDHGVTIVASGTEAGTPFFTVRNSWGSSWGESGHIRLEANVNCLGIETTAVDGNVWPILG